MNCPKCGFNNAEGASTCANCQANLIGSQPTPTSQIHNAEGTETPQSQVLPTMPNVANPGFVPIQTEVSAPKKNKKGLLFALVGLIIVAAVAVVAVIILLNRKDTGDEDASLDVILTDSKAFSLEDKQGNEAIFDVDGKQVTQFEFSSVGEFVNGATNVEKITGENGIISASGKMLVDYGQCRTISQIGSFYRCVQEDFYDSLLDSQGKEVLKENADLHFDIVETASDYGYVTVRTEAEDDSGEEDVNFVVYDYKGKNLLTFAADINDREEPYALANKDYVSLNYKNTTYIFDIAQSKLLLTLQSERMYINDVNLLTAGELTLTSYNGKDYEYHYRHDVDDRDATRTYKFVKDGEVKYDKTTENHYSNLSFEGNNVVFQDDDDVFVLDIDGNEALKVGYTIYQDYNNYVSLNSETRKADLYIDGNLKETFNCGYIQGGYALQGIYLLDDCRDYGNEVSVDKMFVASNGTRLNDKLYMYAFPFDENGYAVVTEDNQNYYLINTKGEKVSDDYSNDRSSTKIFAVEGTKNLYIGVDKDGCETIFEAGGTPLISGDSITAGSIKAGSFAFIRDNTKYIVYDLKKKSEVGTFDSKPFSMEYYFKVDDEHSEKYYSYTTGKMFYEK